MTDFQSQCYEALKKVPRGMVITYGGLAKMIGNPKATRAVGEALNKNYSTAIPCHRVVKVNGDIRGFNEDISVKIKRLQEEGVAVCDNKIVDFEKINFKNF